MSTYLLQASHLTKTIRILTAMVFVIQMKLTDVLIILLVIIIQMLLKRIFHVIIVLEWVIMMEMDLMIVGY